MEFSENHTVFQIKHENSLLALGEERWKPEILGFYSLDQNREYHHDARNLRYFFYRDPNQMVMDLKKGIENYQEKDESQLENAEKIDAVLQWLTRQRYLQSILAPFENKFIFVGFRGSFAAIMRTPYENRNDWLICAMKYENLIFLCIFYTESKKEQLRSGYQEQPMFYYGRKFEQYMLSEDPLRAPYEEAPVNANEDFCVMVSNKIGKHKIIFGAEVDGVFSKKRIDPKNSDSNVELNRSLSLMELKSTHQGALLPNRPFFKNYTTMKWWVQSYLPGVQKMVVGLRDNSAVVKELKYFAVNDLTSSTNSVNWKPAVCKNILDDFLSFLGQQFENQPNKTLFQFEWKLGSKVIQCKKLDAQSDYNFLPDWFLTECDKILEQKRIQKQSKSENSINRKKMWKRKENTIITPINKNHRIPSRRYKVEKFLYHDEKIPQSESGCHQ